MRFTVAVVGFIIAALSPAQPIRFIARRRFRAIAAAPAPGATRRTNGAETECNSGRTATAGAGCYMAMDGHRDDHCHIA